MGENVSYGCGLMIRRSGSGVGFPDRIRYRNLVARLRVWGGPEATRTFRSTSSRALCFYQVLGVNGEIKKSVHHFVPGLLAKPDGLCRVRVHLVVCRVVEVRQRLYASPLWDRDRRLRIIVHLPVEVVF